MKKRRLGLFFACAALMSSVCLVYTVSAFASRTDEERWQELMAHFDPLAPYKNEEAVPEGAAPVISTEVESLNPRDMVSYQNGEIADIPYDPEQESGETQTPPSQGTEPSEGLLDAQFYSNPAFTAVDLKDNFEHYAEPDATVTIPEEFIPEDCLKCHVVGIVLDRDSKIPVPAASIYVDGEFVVTTGSNGRFQIRDLPSGSYDWTVISDTYKEGQFLGYPTGDYGADIFTFYVDKYVENVSCYEYQLETNLPGFWTSGESQS